MSVREVEIVLPAVGGRGSVEKIEIDGNDFTRSVNRLQVDAKAGEPTTVTLGFPDIDQTTVRGAAKIRVFDETRAALLVLGWKPPADVPEGARFWVKVVLAEFLAEIRENAGLAGWTVVQTVKLPPECGFDSWMVEIVDPKAPNAANGLVLNPTLQTNADGTITVIDYGIPVVPRTKLVSESGPELVDVPKATLVIDKVELRGVDLNGVPEFKVLALHREEAPQDAG